MVYRVSAPREIRGMREKAPWEGRYGVNSVYRVGRGDEETGDRAAVESTEERACDRGMAGSVRHDYPTLILTFKPEELILHARKKTPSSCSSITAQDRGSRLEAAQGGGWPDRLSRVPSI